MVKSAVRNRTQYPEPSAPMDVLNLILLGIITGFTIFLGLPVARMKSVSLKTKGRLNAVSVGILLFLLVDVLGNALGATKQSILAAWAGTGPVQAAALHSALLIAGLVLGLLGLVWYESHYLRKPDSKPSKKGLTFERAKQLSFMIALGIGFHNFSEGLAIGQSYAAGATSLALLLVIGFALHNATEGFGIAAPLSGFKPDWGFLAKMATIGGGPTLVGTLLGSAWTSAGASIFFFALAAGAILYVVKELLYHGRLQGEGSGSMGALIFGFLIGFATDVIVASAGG